MSVLARILNPTDYGSFAMVLSIVGVASILGDFGLSLSSIQSQTITPQQRSNLFWTNVLLGLLLGTAIFFAAPLVGAFFDRPPLAEIMRVMSLTFLINAFAPQFRAEMTSRLKFRQLAVTDITAQAVGLTTAIIVATHGGGYWALVTQQLSAAIVSVIVLAVAAGWAPGRPRRGATMRSLYTFGLHTLGSQVINYATSNIDNIVIGRLFGAHELGVYSRAYQIFMLPLLQIAAPMTRVAVPILSKLQNDSRYDAYVQRAQILLSYCFGGFFFVLAAIAAPAVALLLGPNWSGAVPIFAVLAIGGVFQSLGYVYYWIFLSRAFTAIQLKYNLIGRGIMVGLILLGALWGPIGVAVGASAGQMVLWLISTLFAVPQTGVDVKKLVTLTVRPIIIYSVLVALALPLSLTVLHDWNPWAQLGVLGALIIVYGAIVLVIFRPVRSDVALIWDTVTRIRRRPAPA